MYAGPISCNISAYQSENFLKICCTRSREWFLLSSWFFLFSKKSVSVFGGKKKLSKKKKKGSNCNVLALLEKLQFAKPSYLLNRPLDYILLCIILLFCKWNPQSVLQNTSHVQTNIFPLFMYLQRKLSKL